MMMALALQAFGAADRRLFCFDTFEGMPPPDSIDVRHSDGIPASTILSATSKEEGNLYWAISSLETVRSNLAKTRYPEHLIEYVKGRVELTMPKHLPNRIALLRLDTDWYKSTKHELIHGYPRISPGGVMIVDDYGFWRGSRKAVDEYLAETGASVLLNRIDETGRIAVKPSGP
jgi:hypothetical protein